jgi:hypothetical protein
VTWSINFDVKDGRIDGDVRINGTPADGPISVTGHRSASQEALSATAYGISVGTTKWTPAPKADEPAP